MGPLAHPWARPGLLGRTETALRENCAASKLRCEETALRANGSAGARSVEVQFYPPKRPLRDDFLAQNKILLPLRAYPPTRLHAAQFLRNAAHAQRNFLAAQFLLFLANRGGPRGGPRAPKKGPRGPGAARGPRGRRALRARTGGRALRARGRLYATRAMPNGIDNTRRKHFRMESIQAEENVRKIKQQQIRVRSMYARDTYTNSQAGAVSSACRSGSKEDPRLLRGKPR